MSLANGRIGSGTGQGTTTRPLTHQEQALQLHGSPKQMTAHVGDRDRSVPPRGPKEASMSRRPPIGHSLRPARAGVGKDTGTAPHATPAVAAYALRTTHPLAPRAAHRVN